MTCYSRRNGIKILNKIDLTLLIRHFKDLLIAHISIKYIENYEMSIKKLIYEYSDSLQPPE